MLWHSSAVDGAKRHQTPHGVQRCPCSHIGGETAPFAASLALSGGHCGEGALRGSWCRPPAHPAVTTSARGTSSLFLTPRPIRPRGAEQEADGDHFNKVGWSQREARSRGWVSSPGSSTPRCSGHPWNPRLELSIIPTGSWSRCVLLPRTGDTERVPSGRRAPPAPRPGARGEAVTAGIVLNPAPCPRRAEKGSPRGVTLVW